MAVKLSTKPLKLIGGALIVIAAGLVILPGILSYLTSLSHLFLFILLAFSLSLLLAACLMRMKLLKPSEAARANGMDKPGPLE